MENILNSQCSYFVFLINNMHSLSTPEQLKNKLIIVEV